jgi:hypothetical protein
MGIASGQSSTAGCQGDLSRRMKTGQRKVFRANKGIFAGKEDPFSTGPQDHQVVRLRDQLRTGEKIVTEIGRSNTYFP